MFGGLRGSLGSALEPHSGASGAAYGALRAPGRGAQRRSKMQFVFQFGVSRGVLVATAGSTPKFWSKRATGQVQGGRASGSRAKVAKN
eukprot:8665311-Pyramimonas_sp.AAC.1